LAFATDKPETQVPDHAQKAPGKPKSRQIIQIVRAYREIGATSQMFCALSPQNTAAYLSVQSDGVLNFADVSSLPVEKVFSVYDLCVFWVR